MDELARLRFPGGGRVKLGKFYEHRSLLLQHDLVAFFEAGDDFGDGSVGESDGDGDLAEALFLMFVGNLDRGILLVVVEHSVFRNGEDALVLIEENFGVGGHVGLELAAGVVDGDANLEGRDVVLFHAHRSDLGHFAIEKCGRGSFPP